MKIFKYTENLAVFVEIARAGSFSAVATRHNTSPSSVMRKIDTLEDVFGAQLFTRSARGVVLTEIGEVLFKKAIHILDELSDMHKEVGVLTTGLHGTLRISCLPTFAKLYIFPRLKQFKQDYPHIDLELDLTERLSNPSMERLDAALRIGQLRDSHLYTTYIGCQKWVICASPEYLTQYGHPQNLKALSQHHLLDKYYDPNAVCWRRILPDADKELSRVYLKCNDFDTLRQAAVAGLGIAFLPNWVVAKDVLEHRLVKLLDDPEQSIDDIHFLRALPKVTPKLQAFIDFVKQNLKEAHI